MAKLTTRRGFTGLALAAAALIAGGSLLFSGDSAQAANASVSIVNLSFSPASVTVNVGDTVTWTNNDTGVSHTVTSDPPGTTLASGVLTTGMTYAHTFTAAGTFPYHCAIHPQMLGTVTVQQAGTATSTATATATSTTGTTSTPTATSTTGATSTATATATGTAATATPTRTATSAPATATATPRPPTATTAAGSPTTAATAAASAVPGAPRTGSTPPGGGDDAYTWILLATAGLGAVAGGTALAVRRRR